MNIVRIVAIVLIVLGVIALVYQGITYTTREKVLKIGPIEATAEKKKTVPLPPVIGGAMVVGGIIILLTAGRGRRAA